MQYTEHANVPRCEFAMSCLKRCMLWDEDKFGLEYDLDRFNIVAVSHFGGAMENKSLNIFSTCLIVATPESTTDAGLESVDAVIAHECKHSSFLVGFFTRLTEQLLCRLSQLDWRSRDLP